MFIGAQKTVLFEMVLMSTNNAYQFRPQSTVLLIKDFMHNLLLNEP